MIDKIIIWTDGKVKVFDENGEVIPKCRGECEFETSKVMNFGGNQVYDVLKLTCTIRKPFLPFSEVE